MLIGTSRTKLGVIFNDECFLPGGHKSFLMGGSFLGVFLSMLNFDLLLLYSPKIVYSISTSSL